MFVVFLRSKGICRMVPFFHNLAILPFCNKTCLLLTRTLRSHLLCQIFLIFLGSIGSILVCLFLVVLSSVPAFHWHQHFLLVLAFEKLIFWVVALLVAPVELPRPVVFLVPWLLSSGLPLPFRYSWGCVTLLLTLQFFSFLYFFRLLFPPSFCCIPSVLPCIYSRFTSFVEPCSSF